VEHPAGGRRRRWALEPWNKDLEGQTLRREMTPAHMPAVLQKLKKSLRSRRPAIEMVAVAILARLPNHRIRVAGLRRLGASLAPSAVLYHGFQVRAARKLTIGDRSNIGDGAVLDARGVLTIGSDVNFSTGVQVWTAQHDWSSSDFAYLTAPVIIGDRVWVGPRVTILPGASIGEGVVVAAGAVVRGKLDPFGLYGGVPARKIGDRRHDLTYQLPQPKAKAWWW
jgi:acetyltransferase-like isoleucine patch superfamily enzyme